MTDTYLLLLESSTTNCSVGIARNETLLFVREINAGYTHAEHMPVFVEEVLLASGIEKHQLSGVAVGTGPGSYTGLRIGASLAKGIAYGLGIPAIGISSLYILSRMYFEGYSYNSGSISTSILAVMNSRKGEVYAGAYSSSGEEILCPAPYTVGEDDRELMRMLAEGAICVGPGCAMYGNTGEGTGVVFPSVRGMVKSTFKHFEAKKFLDIAYFEPEYLKEFIGVRKN
jgi:tRNA threonylcarbamoyladenosine biosynthesis protein TsaB